MDDLQWVGAGAVPTAEQLAEQRSAAAAALRPADSGYAAAHSAAYAAALQGDASPGAKLAVLPARRLVADVDAGAFGTDPWPAAVEGPRDPAAAARAAAAPKQVSMPASQCRSTARAAATSMVSMLNGLDPQLSAAAMSLCSLQFNLMDSVVLLRAGDLAVPPADAGSGGSLLGIRAGPDAGQAAAPRLPHRRHHPSTGRGLAVRIESSSDASARTLRTVRVGCDKSAMIQLQQLQHSV